MANIIKTKIGKVDISTLAIAGLTKYFEERLFATFIGNGTLMSGAIKLGIGMATQSFLGNNKYANAVALGFGIDGVEDILTSVLGATGSTGTFGENGRGSM